MIRMDVAASEPVIVVRFVVVGFVASRLRSGSTPKTAKAPKCFATERGLPEKSQGEKLFVLLLFY